MRQVFVKCETEDDAAKVCPWAARIVKVEGGYMCFESVTDYETWQNQN
jgi:hypothetical protein